MKLLTDTIKFLNYFKKRENIFFHKILRLNQEIKSICSMIAIKHKENNVLIDEKNKLFQCGVIEEKALHDNQLRYASLSCQQEVISFDLNKLEEQKKAYLKTLDDLMLQQKIVKKKYLNLKML